MNELYDNSYDDTSVYDNEWKRGVLRMFLLNWGADKYLIQSIEGYVGEFPPQDLEQLIVYNGDRSKKNMYAIIYDSPENLNLKDLDRADLWNNILVGCIEWDSLECFKFVVEHISTQTDMEPVWIILTVIDARLDGPKPMELITERPLSLKVYNSSGREPYKIFVHIYDNYPRLRYLNKLLEVIIWRLLLEGRYGYIHVLSRELSTAYGQRIVDRVIRNLPLERLKDLVSEIVDGPLKLSIPNISTAIKVGRPKFVKYIIEIIRESNMTSLSRIWVENFAIDRYSRSDALFTAIEYGWRVILTLTSVRNFSNPASQLFMRRYLNLDHSMAEDNHDTENIIELYLKNVVNQGRYDLSTYYDETLVQMIGSSYPLDGRLFIWIADQIPKTYRNREHSKAMSRGFLLFELRDIMLNDDRETAFDKISKIVPHLVNKTRWSSIRKILEISYDMVRQDVNGYFNEVDALNNLLTHTDN